MVDSVLVISSHTYPCLYYQRHIISKEGLHHGPCLGRPAMMVIPKTRLDILAECPYLLLFTVPAPACRNPGVDKFPGLQRDPRLAEPFPPRWLGDGPSELRKKLVDSSWGLW